jgi:hypothetical protein
MAAFRDLESVILGEERELFVTSGFSQGSLVLLVEDIRDALEEEEWEDIGLEICRIHRTAKDVRGFP